jgi:hypothetical protein
MNDNNDCPKCGAKAWGLSNVGLPRALECLDCGEVYSSKGEWREITKGQIDECLKHSDNYAARLYDFAWAIEAICKANNGY